MSFYAGYIYVLLAVTGILLNAYVIARLIQLAVRDYVSVLIAANIYYNHLIYFLSTTFKLIICFNFRRDLSMVVDFRWRQCRRVT